MLGMNGGLALFMSMTLVSRIEILKSKTKFMTAFS